MLIYAKYVRDNFWRSFLTVLIVLVSGMWSIQLGKIIKLVIKSGAHASIIISLSVNLLPYLLYHMLPIAVLLGGISMLYRMDKKGEIVAMNALGISCGDFFRISNKAILLIFCVHCLLSFYVMPWAYSNFRAIKSEIGDIYFAALLEEGAFVTSIPGVSFYVDKRQDNQNFRGIFIDDKRRPANRVTISAKSGIIKQTNGFIVDLKLQNGTYQMNKGGAIKECLFFDEYFITLELPNDKKVFAAIYGDVKEYSISELWSFLRSDQCSLRLRGMFHQRIVWPIYSVMLAVIFFLFLPYAHFHGKSSRVYIAIVLGLVGIGLSIINFMLYNISMQVRWVIMLTYAVPLTTLATIYITTFKPLTTYNVRKKIGS